VAIEFFDTSNTSEYDLGGLLAYDHYRMHREKTASNHESLLTMSIWMLWAKGDGGFSDEFLEGYRNFFEVIGTGWVCLLENLPTVDHPLDRCPDAFFPNVHPDATKLPRKDYLV